MKNFIILFILLSSCSGKIKEGLFCKSNSDCNKTDSVCKTSVCNNNVCIENHKEDLTSCGNDEVCYDGNCGLMSGSCNTNQDCVSGNPCTTGICSEINTCIYSNKDEGTSCGDEGICANGFCSNKCVKDENCAVTNDCITGTCSKNNFYFDVDYNINNLFYLEPYWYARSSNTVIKYNSNFVVQESYTLNTGSTNFHTANQMYSDGKNWYISLGDFIKVYNLDFQFINDISLSTNIAITASNPKGILTNIYGILKFLDSWYVLASYETLRDLVKFDKDFKYIKHVPLTDGAIGAAKYLISSNGVNLFLLRRLASMFNIIEFDTNLSQTGNIYDFSEYKELYGFTAFTNGPYFYKDGAWYLAASQPKKQIVIFDENFNIKSYCSYSKKENGIICPGGYCNAGYCKDCYNNDNCNDSKPCTADTCSFGVCNNTNIEDKTVCQSNPKKYCFSGECLADMCSSDSDCPGTTFCKRHYCDQTENKCSTENIKEGEYCPKENKPENTYYCKGGNCFIDYRFCNVFNANANGGAHSFYFAKSSNFSFGVYNGVNQEILINTAQYRINDVFNCGGVKEKTPEGSAWLTAYGNNPNTPEKDGFNSGETVTFIGRSKDFVCRYKVDFNVEPGWVSNGKWYSTAISKILNVKDYTNNSVNAPWKTENPLWNLNFDEKNNCCPYNDLQCISKIGKLDVL